MLLRFFCWVPNISRISNSIYRPHDLENVFNYWKFRSLQISKVQWLPFVLIKCPNENKLIIRVFGFQLKINHCAQSAWPTMNINPMNRWLSVLEIKFYRVATVLSDVFLGIIESIYKSWIPVIFFFNFDENINRWLSFSSNDFSSSLTNGNFSFKKLAQKKLFKSHLRK